MFDRLQAADLKYKRTKCDLLKCRLHYLGHLISGEGIYPSSKKVKSINNIPAPKMTEEVWQILSLTGYYEKFLPNYAD